MLPTVSFLFVWMYVHVRTFVWEIRTSCAVSFLFAFTCRMAFGLAPLIRDGEGAENHVLLLSGGMASSGMTQRKDDVAARGVAML